MVKDYSFYSFTKNFCIREVIVGRMVNSYNNQVSINFTWNKFTTISYIDTCTCVWTKENSTVTIRSIFSMDHIAGRKISLLVMPSVSQDWLPIKKSLGWVVDRRWVKESFLDLTLYMYLVGNLIYLKYWNHWHDQECGEQLFVPLHILPIFYLIAFQIYLIQEWSCDLKALFSSYSFRVRI